MTDRPMQAIQVSILILFAFGFCAAMFGIVVDRANTNAFATVTTFITAGIILILISLAPQQLVRRIKFGPLEAEIGELKKDVSDQQETIKQLVIYSLAEIIYRDLLWRIGHNLEVKCDHTADQQRWLTLLFDHGLLQAKYEGPWKPFDQIPQDQNLSDIFKPTPAAEYLMTLRGAPK